MLKAYYELAAPAIARGGGAIEHFTGDGITSTFNARGELRDHATRAAVTALAMARLLDAHPSWPGLRVGVNTGEAIVREMGGHDHIAYGVVSDCVNVSARLESHAPLGGVLIGAETYRRLPPGAVAERQEALSVKGKDAKVDAYLLQSLPDRVMRSRA